MTTIRFRNEHYYDGPADDDRLDIVIRVFAYDGTPLSMNAILDTGAEDCIFSKQYTPLLGIADLRASTNTKVVQTADNREFTAHFYDLDIEFLGHALTVPIGFVPEWSDDVDNLLGMRGFFDQLLFGLDHRSRRLYFSRGSATISA